MKRVVLALALVACKSHVEDPTPPGTPLLQGAKPAPDATATAVVADAAAIAIAIDAAAPIAQLEIPTKQASFGCFAHAKNTVACIVGTRAVNLGDTDVALVVVPGTTKIVLEHRGESENYVRGPDDELAPDLVKQLTVTLHDFVPLAHTPATIASQRQDRSMRAGPAKTTGAWTFDAKLARDGNGAVAPKYQFTVTARTAKVAPVALLDTNVTLSDARVHAFPLGDRVLVEVTWNTGDEGMYSDNGAVWLCDATACTPVE